MSATRGTKLGGQAPAGGVLLDVARWLIGAAGEGCGPSAVEPATWGAIKAKFRD